MSRHRFLWALGFALLAGVSVPLSILATAPWLGYGEAFCLHAMLLTVIAPAFHADSARRGMLGVGLSALLSLFALLLAGRPGVAVVAAPFIFALTRSGVASPRPLGRAIALELALAAIALLLAALPYGGGPVADGLAVWCYWLVQSAHRALGAPSEGRPAPELDRFVAAQRAAERVMGRW